MAGGIDTNMAEQMVAAQCSVTLPRIDGADYISLLDECGGHTNEYHFHERMSCLYDATVAGHSPRIGTASDGKGIYGKWDVQPTTPGDDSTGTLPALDACGGQFGVTPDSNGEEVYHYQVQDSPPFTIGCFGPAADGGLVSLEECRSLYEGCGDGDTIDVTTSAGTVAYDPWCPCFDQTTGSNVLLVDGEEHVGGTSENAANVGVGGAEAKPSGACRAKVAAMIVVAVVAFATCTAFAA